jgi:hypothetical protein
MNSVEILPDPPQSFSVALTFKDRTHEQFERSAVQLRSWDLALAGRLTVKAEGLTELLFRASSRSVDLVSEDEDRTVGQLLVGQQRVQLGLGLGESVTIAAVHQEDDGVHRGKVVAPDLKVIFNFINFFSSTSINNSMSTDNSSKICSNR